MTYKSFRYEISINPYPSYIQIVVCSHGERKSKGMGFSAAKDVRLLFEEHGEEIRESGDDETKKAQGYTLDEILAAGVSLDEIRHAGFPLEVLRKHGGISTAELHEAGFEASEFTSEAGFSAAELVSAGFTEGEVLGAGYPQKEVDLILRPKNKGKMGKGKPKAK